MNKYEKEEKDDIANRLNISNKVLWSSLSEKIKVAIVDKYYHWNDIENIGLSSILENNRQMRKDYAFMILGISIGLLGNIFISTVFKYFPKDSLLFDSSITILFICLIIYIIKQFNKISSDDLENNNILSHLKEMVKQDNKAEMKKKK